jgi:sugar lactone lactonase YvrE
MNSRILKIAYFALFLVICILSNGWSSTPHIRSYTSFSDLKRGEANGISITHRGELVLAPQLTRLIDTGDPFIWCVSRDSKNNLYLGTGNDGRVYRISSKGDSTIFFDAPELEVYCLTIDRQDNVYIGTFPKGKIYRVTKDGESMIVADPPDTYIWAMEFDQQGNLFVATGQKGRIYKIDRHNHMETFFESEENHIRSLAFDAHGRLFAGSGGNGYIYSFSKTGDAFVLYDSPMREIHQLTVTANGYVFAAAMGEEGTPMPTFPESTAQPQKSTEVNQESEETSEVSLAPQALSPAKAIGQALERSALYRIDPDGAARDIWDLDSDRVQCFIALHDSVLFVGTGDRGRLYKLSTEGDRSMILDLEEMHISHLQRASSGEIQVCTSNMGRFYMLGPQTNQTGTYQSETYDARVLAQWGNIAWKEKATGRGDVRFFTRTGNTEEPGQTWSEWSRPYTSNKGESITNSPARFIQWKCELSASSNQSPIIDDITFAYLQKNVPPIITAVIVHRHGDYYPSSGNQTSSRDNNEGRKGLVFPQPLNKPEHRKGFRSIDWMFEDPNSDALQFDLYYKREDDVDWTELATQLVSSVYSWDSAQMPDGYYWTKVVGTDLPSNPPKLAQSASKISELFLIDNTGPVVTTISCKKQNDNLLISFKVTDQWSVVCKVEMSLNAQGWELIYPNDGICDSLTEDFEINLPALKYNLKTIAIRATDNMENIGFGTTVLKE